MKMIGLMLAMLAVTTGARAQVFLSQPPAEWTAGNVLEWTIFDVNEGDAMLLRCGGESMLVDGGPRPFRQSLREALQARGLEHMTYILSTHYHDDHIDGITSLFANGFTADEYLHGYSDSAIESNTRGRNTVNAAKKNGVPVRRVGNGDTLTLGEASIEIHQCTTILNTNARSLVLKVTYKESTILLCADIIGDAQHDFVENLPADALNADLIKMPHHAVTPAVPAFLDAVSPEAAIVTNCSGRVKRPSVNQLESRDLPVFYSGDGTVCAVTDGVDWYVSQTKGEF